MFSSINRYLGVVEVEETLTDIVVTGIPTAHIFRDIDKVWGTTGATKHMFTTVAGSKFSFPKFFLPDFWHTLSLIEEYKSKFTKSVTIHKIRREILEKTWFKDTTGEFPNILNFAKARSLPWKPLPHQDDFLRVYNDAVPRMGLNGLVLAAKPGSGKTFATLILQECLGSKVVFMIVPKNSVHDVWEKTILALYGQNASYWTSLQNKPLAKGKRFYVFHYETLEQALSFVKQHPEYKGMSPFIGVDECQAFNNTEAQRTQYLVELHQLLEIENAVWGSGTPWKSQGREVIPFLRSCDPLFTKDAEDRFIKIFGKSSTRALEILAHRIGRISFKLPASQNMVAQPIVREIKVKLPKPERYTLPVIKEDMRKYIVDRTDYYISKTPEIEKTYQRLIDRHAETVVTSEGKAALRVYQDQIKAIRKNHDPAVMGDVMKACNAYEKTVILPSLDPKDRKEFAWVKSRYKYIDLVIMGECLGNVLGKRRQECYSDMVMHVDLTHYISEAEKKTLIFSDYVETIRVAERKLVSEGHHPLMVYGDTNKDLKNIVKRFFDEPLTNPLLATIMSLSTAVPLIAANTVIFLNQPFRSVDKEQAVARVARLGQDTQTYVWDVILDTGTVPNISTRSQDIMEWSKQQVAIMLGEKTLDSSDEDVLISSVMGGAYHIDGTDSPFTSLANIVRKWFS